jgi:hypothetical protein
MRKKSRLAFLFVFALLALPMVAQPGLGTFLTFPFPGS